MTVMLFIYLSILFIYFSEQMKKNTDANETQ